MKTFKLTFTGDLFPGNIIESVGVGIASKFSIHNGNPWKKNLSKIFSDSDFNFINLESPLISNNLNPELNSFAGSTDFAKFLQNVGVNAASIANNHILEHGKKGFMSTIKALNDSSILPIGINENGNSKIQEFKIENITIGIIGYNNIHDIYNDLHYANYNKQDVFKDLKRMELKKYDYKIISVHWGDEYVNIPSSQQIIDARSFIDKGADIVVGHHPHTIQPFEEYNGGVIFYSLGNFMSDMIWSKKIRMGGIANIYLNKENIIKTDLTTVHIDDDFIPKKRVDLIFDKFLFSNKEFLNTFNLSTKKLYDKNYFSLVKKKSLLNRFLMKKILIKNWFKIPKSQRRIFLKTIINRFKI